MVVIKQPFGTTRRSSNRKRILPVVLRNAKGEQQHVGFTDAVPGDAWCRIHKIDPRSIRERRITKTNGKDFWLLVQR